MDSGLGFLIVRAKIVIFFHISALELRNLLVNWKIIA